MFTKVSVLVPTRQRIDRLRTMIASFDVTTGNGPEAELVFRVDSDDHATRDFLLAWGGHQVVVGPRLQGYSSMAAFFNELYASCSGDVLMVGNDDMVFRTPGWPAAILAAANLYPDGLFDLGVSTYNEDHWPFACTSRTAADRLGFFWDPRIYWGDIYLRDVMGSMGRAVRVPEVTIDHDWAGHAPDSVFSEANQNDIYRRDPTYWNGTHATAVAEAVAKLSGAAA